jgi:hypothetical protein
MMPSISHVPALERTCALRDSELTDIMAAPVSFARLAPIPLALLVFAFFEVEDCGRNWQYRKNIWLL